MWSRAVQRLSGFAKAVRSGLGLSAQPHFVIDHQVQFQKLAREFGRDQALVRAMGGNFAFGKLEAALLRHLGFGSGQFIVDVGCGSGRLASAIADWPGIRYHGTDVVPGLLAHARKVSPTHFRFSRVGGLTIPEQDGVADFVVFFSVATHLMHHETYLYLIEAKRVLKPGGAIVMSFLEFADSRHWQLFMDSVQRARNVARAPINAFIEASAIEVWAGRLGLVVERMLRADSPRVVLPEPIVRDDGSTITEFRNLGQSVAVLRKPAE